MEIEKSNAYNRSLIEASLDPLVTIGIDGKITDVNQATINATGYLKEELIGTDFANYFVEYEKAREGYKKVFHDGKVFDYILHLKHRSGTIRTVAYNASVYKDENENVIGVFAAARDITEQKKIEKELERANAYHRNLIEASLDPLVTIGIDGKITDVNHATINATGHSKEELIGTDFANYFVEYEKAREGYKKAFLDGKVFDYILHLKNKDGSIRTVAYNASVYRDADDKVIGVFAAARDITEQKKVEKELEKYRENLEELVKIRTQELEKANKELIFSKEDAERANLAKSEFLANMSHELRTPLNGIVGFSQALREMETDKQKIDFLDIMNESSKHLLSLINDILSLSKIEAGKQDVFNENFDFYDLIKNIEGIFAQQVRTKGLELIVESDKTIPKIIHGDRTIILQILNNLLSNSMKFTKEGYIKLTVKDMTPEEKINKKIEFSVKDTGIGINEEKQKRLYEPFEQGEGYLRKTYGGTGLGLAIVKKLVDLIKGEIRVETQVGRGTEITITLPFEIVEEIKIDTEITKNELNGNLNILLAEDDKASAILIKIIARKENWNIVSVSNGKELLEELEKNTYDLVLTDIQMPIMDGLEATRIIRQNKKYENLLIIAVSAFAMEDEIERALKSGINSYITKPISIFKLKEAISKVFK